MTDSVFSVTSPPPRLSCLVCPCFLSHTSLLPFLPPLPSPSSPFSLPSPTRSSLLSSLVCSCFLSPFSPSSSPPLLLLLSLPFPLSSLCCPPPKDKGSDHHTGLPKSEQPTAQHRKSGPTFQAKCFRKGQGSGIGLVPTNKQGVQHKAISQTFRLKLDCFKQVQKSFVTNDSLPFSLLSVHRHEQNTSQRDGRGAGPRSQEDHPRTIRASRAHPDVC